MVDVKKVAVAVVACVVVCAVVVMLSVFLQPGIRTQPTVSPYPEVTATFISSFDDSIYNEGITKVEDKIYILKRYPNRIKVYEDLISFRFMREIAITSIKSPDDIVYSNESKCVYITYYTEGCIRVMTTTGEHRLTKWVDNILLPYSLSLSNEGHLLVVRKSYQYTQDSLEIYSLNATLIRSLQFPQEVKDPEHVVQTSAGNYIISHRLNNESNGLVVISQLTSDGQLINRFIPKSQSEELSNPEELALDSDNNRLFVADSSNHRVILLDSNLLTWIQVLLSEETNNIRYPRRLFYDAGKRHLFVAELFDKVSAFEIN